MNRSLCRSLWAGGALVFAAIALLVLAGCVSKSKAQARTRRAYLAGQQQALARMPHGVDPSSSAPTIAFVGPVKNPVLIWSPDLTLAHALVEAGYEGATDPAAIIIHRTGEEISITPQ